MDAVERGEGEKAAELGQAARVLSSIYSAYAISSVV